MELIPFCETPPSFIKNLDLHKESEKTTKGFLLDFVSNSSQKFYDGSMDNFIFRSVYFSLSNNILNDIARERNIILTGNFKTKCKQLSEFDSILNYKWLKSISSIDINNIPDLSVSQLYLYGVLNGVDFNGIGHITNKILITYIQLCILIKNPKHKYRHFIKILINKIDRNMLEFLFNKFIKSKFEHILLNSRDTIRSLKNDIESISQRNIIS